MTEIVGTVAALITTFASIPQIIKVHKTNNTDDLSFGYFLLFIGICLWMVYGILIGDKIIVTANIITITFTSYLLYKIIVNTKKGVRNVSNVN